MKANLNSDISLLREDKIAVLSQSPWILGRTVRENILLGLPFDEKKFKNAIKLSQFQTDLEEMQDGMYTDVGEGGANISGGQRTRLVLARCIYHEPDLFILDDPLSALDMHVADLILKEALLDGLRHTTRIIATNSINFLNNADKIFIMDQGKIVFEGTYEEIGDNPIYQELKKASENELNEEEGEKKIAKKVEEIEVIKRKSICLLKNEDKLISLFLKEDHKIGSVGFKVLLNCLRVMGGIPSHIIVFLCSMNNAAV